MISSVLSMSGLHRAVPVFDNILIVNRFHYTLWLPKCTTYKNSLSYEIYLDIVKNIEHIYTDRYAKGATCVDSCHWIYPIDMTVQNYELATSDYKWLKHMWNSGWSIAQIRTFDLFVMT